MPSLTHEAVEPGLGAVHQARRPLGQGDLPVVVTVT